MKQAHNLRAYLIEHLYRVKLSNAYIEHLVSDALYIYRQRQSLKLVRFTIPWNDADFKNKFNTLFRNMFHPICFCFYSYKHFLKMQTTYLKLRDGRKHRQTNDFILKLWAMIRGTTCLFSFQIIFICNS